MDEGTAARTVADIMDRTLHAAPASTTVGEAAVIMARARVSSTLVMDDGRLVGIFTERDVVKALSESIESPADLIRLWMTADPRTIAGSVPLEEALERMLRGGLQHLPVVDPWGGAVVGMLSLEDLARAGVHNAEMEPTTE